MTRREALLVLAAAGPLGAASPNTLVLRARSRSARGPVVQTLAWKTSRTAIIICDMWDDHYCVSSARRVAEMVPRMNETVAAARALGVFIIHSPSGTMDFYAGRSERERMRKASYRKPPVPIARWCYLDPKDEAALPIEDQQEPCDDKVLREKKRMYSREHPGLLIDPDDGISADGQEIHNACAERGITNIAIMGVHANVCVLGRPFGIRQQKRLGRNVVLVRDLTDSMYDPRDRPWVSHERGNELVIEHIERYWCPSILSDDLTRSASAATD